MVIRIVPMPYGDCFILQWDSLDGRKRTVILDSGTQQAYRQVIRGFIAELDGDIDLWVISHYHDDHIGGVLKYVDDFNGGIVDTQCKRWMFNYIDNKDASASTDCASIAESVKQGSKLSSFLQGLGFSLKDCLVTAGQIYTLDDVKFTIISPNLEQGVCNMIDTEPASLAAASSTDYHTCISSFNLDDFTEDTSAVNAGSIAVLVEFERKKFLWLSDSRPSDICSALKAMGYSKSRPLICEYMTLPHHGSKGNTSNELLELVRCDKYVVTADGDNVYSLPNKETLVRTIMYNRSISNSKVEFLFPSLSSTPLEIFAVDGKSVFDEYNFCIKTGATLLEI